jgi:hypothetical protein
MVDKIFAVPLFKKRGFVRKVEFALFSSADLPGSPNW